MSFEENFTKHEESARPHVEDHYASGIVKSGYCSEEEFRNLLRASFHSSIAEGFEVEIEEGQKHIKHDTAPSRSLLTIRVNPRTIQIMQSQFDPEKIQISFCDLSNRWFNYLSITDLVLFQHLRSCQDNDKEIQSVKQAIQSSKEVYLRIGLSRIFESSDGRKGYWIQVNGVYPFPDCLDIFQAGD